MLLYWKIKTFKRPCWNTELIVKTWPRAFEKVSSWRDFEMYDNEGNLLVIGSTQWALIDAKELKLAKITEEMANEYGIVERAVFKEEIIGKLKPDENAKKLGEYTARRRDIDTNHHVNNINYLEFAYDVFPENVDVDFNNLEIYYKKQIKLRRNSIYVLFRRE